MKKFLKHVAETAGIICTRILGVLFLIAMFPVILADGIINAISQKKLHLLWWTIEDSYKSLVSLPIIIALICLIITIPLAIEMINDLERQRENRARKWELRHPGKEA